MSNTSPSEALVQIESFNARIQYCLSVYQKDGPQACFNTLIEWGYLDFDCESSGWFQDFVARTLASRCLTDLGCFPEAEKLVDDTRTKVEWCLTKGEFTGYTDHDLNVLIPSWRSKLDIVKGELEAIKAKKDEPGYRKVLTDFGVACEETADGKTHFVRIEDRSKVVERLTAEGMAASTAAEEEVAKAETGGATAEKEVKTKLPVAAPTAVDEAAKKQAEVAAAAAAAAAIDEAATKEAEVIAAATAEEKVRDAAKEQAAKEAEAMKKEKKAAKKRAKRLSQKATRRKKAEEEEAAATALIEATLKKAVAEGSIASASQIDPIEDAKDDEEGESVALVAATSALNLSSPKDDEPGLGRLSRGPSDVGLGSASASRPMAAVEMSSKFKARESECE